MVKINGIKLVMVDVKNVIQAVITVIAVMVHVIEAAIQSRVAHRVIQDVHHVMLVIINVKVAINAKLVIQVVCLLILLVHLV